MKFIVIEGIDGSGKSTQLRYLINYLEKENKPYKYLHFPRSNAPVFGDLISRFLRGDFGPVSAVNPYLVALLYAGDRYDAAPVINQWIDEGNLVVLDRYVYSNIAFQCAKIEDFDQRKTLKDWILNLEYAYYKIPRPDLNLFLDVPFSFASRNLSSKRKGNDRDYLNGKKDIHEADLQFQQKVREMYLWQVNENNDFKLVNCSDFNGNILSPEEIFAEIKNILSL